MSKLGRSIDYILQQEDDNYELGGHAEVILKVL
jgi:hypothetical protein